MPATYEKIATTTLSSAATDITFSSISSAYTDLKLVFVFTPTSALSSRIQFNSDTAGNYSSNLLSGDGTTAASSRTTSISYINSYTVNNTGIAMLEVDIFSYAGSTFKTVLTKWSGDQNGSGLTVLGVGLWRSTSAISTIKLFSNLPTYAAGATATLYGILKA